MSRDADFIDAYIPGLRIERIPATLIASQGHHCETWRVVGSVWRGRARSRLDIVIKVYREACSPREVRAMKREHDRLRRALPGIVPRTTFVSLSINGQPSVVAACPTIRRWFDVANPAHESEAVPLFRQLRRARRHLERFVETADRWDRESDQVIDLFGLDNLVLDTRHHLHYVDSYRVFFYADLLYAIDPPDDALAERIALSRRRLEYLRHLLQESA